MSNKTALEVIQEKGVPEAIYGKMDQKGLNQMAKALDPTFRVPKGDLAIDIDVVPYTNKGNGKKGMFLEIKASTGYKGLFERLCDGHELTPESRTALKAALVGLAERAVAVAESL